MTKNGVGCGAPEVDIQYWSRFTAAADFLYALDQQKNSCRIMERYGLRALNFSNISDSDFNVI